MSEPEKETKGTDDSAYAEGYTLALKLGDPRNRLVLSLPKGDVVAENIPLKVQIALQNAFIKGPYGLHAKVKVNNINYDKKTATEIVIETRL